MLWQNKKKFKQICVVGAIFNCSDTKLGHKLVIKALVELPYITKHRECISHIFSPKIQMLLLEYL